MHRRNSLHRVRMRKKRRVLRGISLGAKFMAVLVGLITSMSTFYPLLFSVIWGILAEVIASRKERRSAGMLAASYVVFNMTSLGSFVAIIVAKEAFLENCTTYYGADYAAALDALTPNWIVAVLIAFALIGGLLGGLLGKRILKKHFEKAGITA